jgi:hypothetical protein
VKHGLYVRAPAGLRLRSRRIRKLKAKVRQVLPWLQPSDEPCVKGWCELELVSARMFADLMVNPEPGKIDLYRRVKSLQLQYEHALGMNPRARAELGLTHAQAMAIGADPREHIARAARAYKQRIAEEQEK